MSTERAILRRAAQLVALAEGLRQDGLGAAIADKAPGPTCWPALTGDEAALEWDALRRWVDQLRVRFPGLVRLPECWWRHNDLVEVLAALRDFERACFAPTAPATAPVEWQRALRDMEHRMELWIKRFTCGVAGRGHDTTVREFAAPDGWADFVDRDITRRQGIRPAGDA